MGKLEAQKKDIILRKNKEMPLDPTEWRFFIAPLPYL
jgi:hypothetical protein